MGNHYSIQIKIKVKTWRYLGHFLLIIFLAFLELFSVKEFNTKVQRKPYVRIKEENIPEQSQLVL